MTPEIIPTYEDNLKKLFNFKDLVGTEEEYGKCYEDSKAASLKIKKLERDCQPWNDANRSIQHCREKIAELEPKIRELRSKESAQRTVVASLEGQLSRIEKATHAFSELKLKWENCQQKLSELNDRKRRQSQSCMSSLGSNNHRSIEELEEQQRQRSERKDSLLNKKERLQNEESALTKRFFFLKTSLAEAEKVHISAKQRGDRHAELESTMRDWRVQSENADNELRNLSNRREEALRGVVDIETNLQQAKLVLSREESTGQQKVNSITACYQQICRLMTSLEDADQKYQQSDLAGVSRALETSQNEIAKKEETNRSLTPRVNSINAEISSQERTRKTVKENIELRELISSHQQLVSNLNLLETTQGSQLALLNDATRELERGEQEQRKLRSEKDKLSGNLEIYHQQAEELQNKLNGSNYKGIDGRFRNKNIQYETTLMAVSDLGAYYDALDKALQNFHYLKIKDINKIIRELWQLIYKGEDIDMIELESGLDANDAAAAATATGARGTRNYNYRVVMRKGDTPLDMRGRCSAGQKVLAAIVIRLALAETFCLNCGILALDEPTTNLDDANKAGLAHALARIIVSRSKQQNFQLLCITHDEDFVRMMSAELSGISDFSLPEYYFRVSREELVDGAGAAKGNGKFFSRIDRIRWDEM